VLFWIYRQEEAVEMLTDFDLTGRRAVVTGAGRGIGKGIALALAEAGADVGVTALGETNAARVAQEITAQGRRGFGWAVDGTRVQPMENLVPRILAELGPVDILVNCIGDSIRGAVAPGTVGDPHVMTESDWHHVVDINLTQVFVGCHAFGPHFLERGQGCVINVSGSAAFRPSVLQTAYAAAKAGITQFTTSLALEWAPHGIRVNAIAPGSFPDPEQLTPEQWQLRQERDTPGIPLKRFGMTREVGLLAVYLSSNAASYVTGQTVGIDGGRSLR
jgi:NAD(P)-dependent dehydrogenase (short-subunit alcohol dehydrogenase family)